MSRQSFFHSAGRPANHFEVQTRNQPGGISTFIDIF